MPRVKRGVIARAAHKKVLEKAKGFRGRRNNVFRVANEAVMRAGQYAYRDRRNKKRVFRSLWITRINAAARASGLSYSRLMNGLSLAQIEEAGIDAAYWALAPIDGGWRLEMADTAAPADLAQRELALARRKSEFDLAPLETSGRKLLELGRSCVHADHRGGTAMFHLWNGLAEYVLDRGIEILRLGAQALPFAG